jgi:four helix bundle protein
VSEGEWALSLLGVEYMIHNEHTPAHQRLDAYRVAIDLFRGVEAAASRFPRGYADMKDQLRRATGAIVRNIAEGANRFHPADKMARFLVARGEAGECEATLEMAQIVGAVPGPEATALRRLAARVSALIGGLIRHQRRVAERSE